MKIYFHTKSEGFYQVIGEAKLQLSKPTIEITNKYGHFVLATADCPEKYKVSQAAADTAQVGLVAEDNVFAVYQNVIPSKKQLYTRFTDEFYDGRFAETTMKQSPINDPRIDAAIEHCTRLYKIAQNSHETAIRNGNYSGEIQANAAMSFYGGIVEMLGSSVEES